MISLISWLDLFVAMEMHVNDCGAAIASLHPVYMIKHQHHGGWPFPLFVSIRVEIQPRPQSIDRLVIAASD